MFDPISQKKLLLPDIDPPDMWVVRHDDDDEWILCCSFETYSEKRVKKVMTHQKAENW